MKKDFQYVLVVWISLAWSVIVQSATPKELEIACRSQMMIIYEALTYYQDATDGEFPNQLGELVGDYLAPEVLYCPAAYAKGETDSGKAGLIDLSSTDGRIRGYKWELAMDRNYTRKDTKGRIYQWVEYKKLQLKTPAGEWVPMVRCEHHATESEPEKRVNLAVNGKIYTSELYWESQFTHLLPYQYMTYDLVEFYVKPLVSFMRQRSPKATPSMIDLRPYANAMPEHPWIWGRWGEEMDEFSSMLSDGIFSSKGINFDISGLIQLGGKLSDDWRNSFDIKHFPDESKLIRVPAQFTKLHILGGVVFSSDIAAKVAFIELLSGERELLSTIPWEYGSDVVDIFQPVDLKNDLPVRYNIVWTEDVMRNRKPAVASLIQMEFENPVIDQDVAFIRFRAGEHYSSPFILGLTLEL